MKRLAMLALLGCALAAACAGERSESKTGREVEADPDRTVETSPEGCRIEKFTVASPSMERRIRVVIVLPPGYDENPGKRYPVLYTLHGRGAPYDTWSQMSPLRRALRDRPMIVTCFDGDRAGWYIDATTRQDSKFTTFFFDEFIPYVDAHYRSSGMRGVTGFSMGGYGAFHYTLTRPELFASVSSLSGAFLEDLASGEGPLGDLLGEYEKNTEAYLRCGIYNRVAERVAKGKSLPPMLIHCGTEDFLLEENRKLANFLIAQNKAIRERLAPQAADEQDERQRSRKLDALMAEHRLDFLHVESPGAHNWAFWRDASEAVVDFHWRSFQAADAD